MAKETVDKILAAENAVERDEADARAKAAEMIEKAKADAAWLVDETIRKAEESADELVEKAKSDAERIMGDMAVDDVIQISPHRKEEAINACILMLVKTGGR